MELNLAYDLIADAFEYPAPGQLDVVEEGLAQLAECGYKQALTAFVGKVRCLSLGDWEELHTRTLDLNPPAAPYVGYQTWGESYQRGEFMSKMNRELSRLAIDPEGELPDHLILILRYLSQENQPLPDLIDVLVPAVQRMIGVLRSADPANPYLDLFEAVQTLCGDLKKEAA